MRASNRVLNEVGLRLLTINLKLIELAILASAAVVYAGRPYLICILHNNLNFCTSMRRMTRPGPFTDDYLLPAVASLIICREELRREALPPLHIELLSCAELN